VRDATVLVVDDSPDVRRILGRALQSVGYSVHLAASGEDALQILREWAVDAVLLDLHMPVMSGQTLFHVIIGLWPNLKPRILIMTGDARAEEHATWLRLYDLPVVKKPFEVGEVVGLIDVIMSADTREASSS
jgi:CheY-like chemotaxis protein